MPPVVDIVKWGGLSALVGAVLAFFISIGVNPMDTTCVPTRSLLDPDLTYMRCPGPAEQRNAVEGHLGVAALGGLGGGGAGLVIFKRKIGWGDEG